LVRLWLILRVLGAEWVFFAEIIVESCGIVRYFGFINALSKLDEEEKDGGIN